MAFAWSVVLLLGVLMMVLGPVLLVTQQMVLRGVVLGVLGIVIATTLIADFKGDNVIRTSLHRPKFPTMSKGLVPLLTGMIPDLSLSSGVPNGYRER